MDLRTCFALACLLASAFSAPVEQQNYPRNFIADRYDIKGDLVNSDGTFSRQDPPEESEQSFYDQLNNEQNSNLAYQQPQEYQSQFGGQNGQYGQQSYSNFQEPGGQFNNEGEQSSFYNSQNPQQEETNDMPLPSTSDDISRGDSDKNSEQYYNQQPQQYQNYQNVDDQPPPVEIQPQGYFGFQQQQQQQSYPQYSYQPQAQETDDMQGTARDQASRDRENNDDTKDDLSSDNEDNVSKRDEILRQRIKKFEIPRNLKRKDLEGMLGFGKQVYLRGGH